MTRIVGPASGHATLTGTSGNDLIIAYGDANTITGAGGNDTIEAESGNDNDIIIGTAAEGFATLTETVRVDGTGDTISGDTAAGGSENVKLVGTISGSDVTLGFGNNTISAVGSGNSFSTAGGNDRVRAIGGNDTVNFTGNAGSIYSDTVASADRITSSMTRCITALTRLTAHWM